MGNVGRYNVIRDFGDLKDPTGITFDPYVVVAVVRLGLPLSFSRVNQASVTKDVSQGALLRAVAPMVITDDCVSMQTQGSKRAHVKTMNMVLKQTDVNYLNEILPGDWIMAWMVNNRTLQQDLMIRINLGQACNGFDDGFKFLGRVHNVRKQTHQDGPRGDRTSSYTIQSQGFSELDSQLFYDASLASSDQRDKAIGSWLARLGLNIEDLFGAATKDGIKKNNTNVIVPTLLDLIVGKGPPAKASSSPLVQTAIGTDVSALPQTLSEPPYSYLVPVMIGQLLGLPPSEASKASHVVSYADILELLQGVQNYSNTSGTGVFTPDIAAGMSTPQRRYTPTPLLGTYLPFFPEFTNKPLFQVLSQYSNPTINEMYTALRVNPEGSVMPTLIFRQIPFTTEAMPAVRDLPVTKFLSLPRWVIPSQMIQDIDIGRSDATRTNFIHIYGASSLTQNNVPVQYQLINNPPIRDDLDIQRSGLRPYIATVECWVDDQIGKAPSQWMSLVTDRMIGSQYTLNGTIYSFGIQSPICEGDNLEFDGVVYHIESVAHQFSISPDGSKKSWTTQVTLTNGLRSDVNVKFSSDVASPFPIYAGFLPADLTANDPGLTLEHVATTGGASNPSGIDEDRQPAKVGTNNSQLNVQEPTEPPRFGGDFDFVPET